jgi:hypothetical protein
MPWTLLAAGAFGGLSEDNLAGVFGDPSPRFFLSGDGHRQPPFGWAEGEAVLPQFLALMGRGELCMHVEQQQEDVRAASVPPRFADLIRQQMVFGWELPIYRDLLAMMQLIYAVKAELPRPSLESVMAVHREMVRIAGLAHVVGNPPWMRQAVVTSDGFKAYWAGIDPRPDRFQLLTTPDKPVYRNEQFARRKSTEDSYRGFLSDYLLDIMQLRTDANQFIGVRIKRNIDLHPNATHLITVGAAHITINPVQQYINLGNLTGLVDPSDYK